jgi:hypothetical protein
MRSNNRKKSGKWIEPDKPGAWKIIYERHSDNEKKRKDKKGKEDDLK